jgi:thiol-disulfide isomerase/thioredoxin
MMLGILWKKLGTYVTVVAIGAVLGVGVRVTWSRFYPGVCPTGTFVAKLAALFAGSPAKAADAQPADAAKPVQTFKPEIGAKVPDIAGKDVRGNDVSLSAYAGKFVFIDFWASWCGPCMGELPNVIAASKKFPADKFQVFSVSLDRPETLAKLQGVIKDNGIEYPVYYDGGWWKTKPAVEWGIHSIPASFVVDRKGVIILKNVRGEQVDKFLSKLLWTDKAYLPVDSHAEPIDKKIGPDGVRVKVTATNPGDDKFKAGVQYAYFLPPEKKGERPVEKDSEITVEATGHSYSGVLTLPVPENALIVYVQSECYASFFGDFVGGNTFEFPAGDES